MHTISFPPRWHPNLEFRSSMTITSTGKYTSRDNQEFLNTTNKIHEHPVQQENSYEDFYYLRLSIHLTEQDLDRIDWRRHAYLFAKPLYSDNPTNLLKSSKVTILSRDLLVDPVFFSSVNTSCNAKAVEYRPDKGNTAIL